MSKKTANNGLGRALKNKLEKKKYAQTGDKAPIFFQQTEENEAEKKKLKMKSIIEQDALNQFLMVAEISQQNFEANRDIKFKEIREELNSKKIINLNSPIRTKVRPVPADILDNIQVPRRPLWKDKNKEELNLAENQAYLHWRRTLAAIEEKNVDWFVSPYEKNLQVWRQLWRVVERADLLVQILDGRNPLFFFSEDLNTYTTEVNPSKKTFLIINKSDLLSPEQRQKWNIYFLENKIDHIFFCAKEAILAPLEPSQTQSTTTQQTNIQEPTLNTPDILTPIQLITVLESYIATFQKQHFQVGMVGYPNVGKSSVINSLLGKKKVGVASMPGKTKHFQTLKLSDVVTLCDCPGLVFPKIAEYQSQMILNGLVPLDTLKKYQESCELIARRIPKNQIQKLYAIHWKQEQIYDSQEVLNKYAKLKGFYTGSGLPNTALAARHILKDYVNGVLVFVHLPGIQEEEFVEIGEVKRTVVMDNEVKKQDYLEKELDAGFFNEKAEFAPLAEMIGMLMEEDLLDLVQGKKLGPYKVTKDMKKSIKFALKRGQDVEKIKKMMKKEMSGQSELVKIK